MAEEITGGGGNFVASPFIEEVEEPKAILANNGHYFTYSDGWVDLGEDLSVINGFEQGVLLSELNAISWWKDFSGVVEILVFTRLDTVVVDAYIERYTDSDVELLPPDVAVDSLTSETTTFEDNKLIVLIKEVASDSELGHEVEIESTPAEAMQIDGNYSVLLEADNGIDTSQQAEAVNLDVDSNLTEPMALDGNYEFLMEGIDASDATVSSDFSLDVDSSLTEAMTLDEDYSLTMEGIDTTDATVSGDFVMDVDSNTTNSIELEGEYGVLLEGLTTFDNEAENSSVEVDSQQTNDTAVSQELDVYGEATSQLRTVISINNGRTWWTFDEDADNWKQTDLRNIDVEGMSIDLLNSLDYFDYEKLAPNRIYTKDLVIATQATSTLEDKETIFRKLDVEFYENQPAFVSNARFSPDSIHNQYTELTFDYVDLEGDNVYYKVLVQRAGEIEYVQIEPNPSEREWNQRPSSGSVFHAYNYPYFNTGENKVKVVVQDSRGLKSEHDFSLILTDDVPYIQMTHDQFGMDLVIGDTQMDSVSYKVSLNGEDLLGFTDFQRSPVNFRYVWKPGQLKRDEINIVRVEVVDSFGNKTIEEFELAGQFTSIMFTDVGGQYLTDNLGELLRYLDFGAIVGGTISPHLAVKVVNETGVAVKNLAIKVLSDQLGEGLTVQLSKEQMPFEETDTIQYSGVMPFQDEKEFYVRIKSGKKVEGIHDFEAVATADTEI